MQKKKKKKKIIFKIYFFIYIVKLLDFLKIYYSFKLFKFKNIISMI
jgi:hypothetical protein